MWSGPSSVPPAEPTAIAAFEIGRRLDLLDAVDARRQVGERVLAVGVGRGRGDAVAGAVEQIDGHAAQERLAGIEASLPLLSTKTWPLMLAGSSSPKS